MLSISVKHSAGISSTLGMTLLIVMPCHFCFVLYSLFVWVTAVRNWRSRLCNIMGVYLPPLVIYNNIKFRPQLNLHTTNMPRPTKKARASTQNLPNRTRAAQASTSPNTNGIATFSSALLFEIASYFPQISLVDVLDNPTTLPVKYRERFAILRALSQTCRDLRGVCLPLAWERLEACTHGESSGQFFREVGTALERKSRGMMKCKHLFPHVRCVLGCTVLRLTLIFLRQDRDCFAHPLPNGHHPSAFCGVPRCPPELTHHPGRPCALADDNPYQERLHREILPDSPHGHHAFLRPRNTKVLPCSRRPVMQRR
jgi:hypothetical protein